MKHLLAILTVLGLSLGAEVQAKIEGVEMLLITGVFSCLLQPREIGPPDVDRFVSISVQDGDTDGGGGRRANDRAGVLTELLTCDAFVSAYFSSLLAAFCFPSPVHTDSSDRTTSSFLCHGPREDIEALKVQILQSILINP